MPPCVWVPEIDEVNLLHGGRLIADDSRGLLIVRFNTKGTELSTLNRSTWKLRYVSGDYNQTGRKWYEGLYQG